MKLDKTTLCYADGDRIIVHKETDLIKYDLKRVTAMENTYIMTVAEYEEMRQCLDCRS